MALVASLCSQHRSFVSYNSSHTYQLVEEPGQTYRNSELYFYKQMSSPGLPSLDDGYVGRRYPTMGQPLAY